MKDERKPVSIRVPTTLLADVNRLIDAYGTTLTTAIIMMLESAVEEWQIPGMEEIKRPIDRDSDIEEEKERT